MDLHREQRTPDQIALLRLAGPDGNVGRPHGDGDLLVTQHQLDADVGIKLEELPQALGDPDGAEPDRRGDAQVAGGLGGGVGEQRFGGSELIHDLAGRPEQHFALLGQHQAARVPMKKRDFEFLLQRRDLPADGRLAHTQGFARVRKAARLGGSMKDPELIPVHWVGFEG